MKTAKEILDKYKSRKLAGDKYREPDIIEAMKEYATQYLDEVWKTLCTWENKKSSFGNYMPPPAKISMCIDRQLIENIKKEMK